MKPGQCRSNRREEGIALLLSLLFVVLMSVIVVEHLYQAHVLAAQVAADEAQWQAEVAAESAVAAGVSLLATDFATGAAAGLAQSGGTVPETQSAGMGGYDGLDEPWALGVQYTTLNDASMQCLIDDEFGKLNLNALYSPMTGQVNETLVEALRILFEQRGATEDPTGAILDWIDPDDDEQPYGAENMYYQGLKAPYACKNGPFSSVEELLMVRGITLELFFGDAEQEQLPLPELLTVHGDSDGQVNINTAELEVLDAVCMTMGQGGLAGMLAEERLDTPFISESDMAARGVVPQTDPDEPQLSPFVVSSRCFRVRGQGICGSCMVRVDAYVWRDERSAAQPLRILDWRVLE